MLIGQHKRAIDAKGRMILPRDYREEFEGGLVITKGLDKCLVIYPIGEWEKLDEKIKDMPEGNFDSRGFKRQLFSNASKLIPDGQGRVLLPTHLREEARLEKEAMVIGLSDKVEVWNPDSWTEYDKRTRERYEEAASEIGV